MINYLKIKWWLSVQLKKKRRYIYKLNHKIMVYIISLKKLTKDTNFMIIFIGLSDVFGCFEHFEIIVLLQNFCNIV